MRTLVAVLLCAIVYQAFASNCHSTKTCVHSHYALLAWQDYLAFENAEAGAKVDIYRGPCGSESLYQSGISGSGFQDNNVVSRQSYCYFVVAVGTRTYQPSNEVSALIP